eukprot:7082906-Pyramimonas_sp.AAC.1
MAHERLHELVPFVRQWYGVPSQFKWRNNNNITLESFGLALVEEKEKLLKFLSKLPSLQSAW